MNTLFASTARGLEELLKSELEALGAQDCKIVQGGVHFSATERVLYESVLWSRFASRILLPLSEFRVYSDLDLYLGIQNIDWPALFSVDKTFAVQFTGTNEEIRNSQYGALKVKDGVVDCFNRRCQQRPDVAKQQPDIRIHVFLHQNIASVSLDLCGEGLHQRGYRSGAGQAPIKENLAAAIVQRSGWQPDTPLLDPMCGSGTLLIEAALMACDQAPGLYRKTWGFMHWQGFNPEVWESVWQAASQRAVIGRKKTSARFYGYDVDEKVLRFAKQNAQQAGVAELFDFRCQDIAQLRNPVPEGATGTLISNPPYGERLESEPALVALHSTLGRLLKSQFPGWRVSLFSAAPSLLDCLQLRADRQFKAKNGPLECVQKNYRLKEGEAKPVGEVAPDFTNRLRKNVRKLEKWAKQEGIECYRLYDADLPDYNVAIDRYQERVVVQEYAPPKSVDPQKARQRLMDVVMATLSVLDLPAHHLVLKTRERQKGKSQYNKLSHSGEFLQVREYNAQFWVNLTDYLDTGLFLDHRLARKKLGSLCRGKDFLNLFAYTGSATVHAGLGRARTTTTLDMSRTYLEWAEKNLRLNGLTGRQHRLIQADCLQWLKHTQDQFDVIFIDPPTFSNSKRMEETFDIQRDHITLMQDLKRILRPGGTLLFSNNKRGFKMDLAALEALGLQAEEITEQTLSLDFARNRQIHNSWLITHCAPNSERKS